MSEKIKVLHLIASNFIGGPEKQIIRHLESADLGRFDLHVGSFVEGGRPNELLDHFCQSKIPLLSVSQRNALDLRCIFTIRNYLKHFNVRVLVSHGYKPHIFGYLATRHLPIAHGMYVRGWTFENKKMEMYNWLDKKCLHKADLVITVAARKMEELRLLGISQERLRYIANAVDIPVENNRRLSIRQEYDLAAVGFIAISVGRFSPEKGHTFLLKSLSILRNNGIHIGCVLFGEGPERGRLEDEVRALGLADVVRFAGFQKNWSLFMDEVDVLVNPSLSEVMPNVVLESMALGCRVVATDVGGVDELIPSSEFGCRVSPGNADVLAAAIGHVLRHVSRCEKVTANAKSHVANNFSFVAQAEKLHDLYIELEKQGKNLG